MNVYQKLNKARELFHKKELRKSGQNKFAGYSYFELGDFVMPALEIFKEVGLTSVITFGAEVAEMVIVDNDKPESIIVIRSPMSEASLKGCHPVQNLGAVQTYLRRYLWVAALEIVEHDALDSSPPVKPEEPPAPKKDEKEGKLVVAGRYEEEPKHTQFLESMINWGNSCTSLTELTDLWKTNQESVDDLKRSNKQLFKQLQEYFAQLKANFKED
jgi:hypothetical protein